MNHEKRAPGWLFDIGDEMLPSYMGIIWDSPVIKQAGFNGK